MPGIVVVPADESATVFWPDFGADDAYVVQFEQADGTWKTVEDEVDPADLLTSRLLRPMVGPSRVRRLTLTTRRPSPICRKVDLQRAHRVGRFVGPGDLGHGGRPRSRWWSRQ